MISIKQFNNEEDIKEKISSLMSSCLKEEYGDKVKTRNTEDLLKYYHSKEESLIYYLTENDIFQGFIWIILSNDILTEEPFCFFLYLAITPESRYKGYGKKLMSYAIDKSKEKGIDEIKLTVRSDNIKAIGMYKSLGFYDYKYEMSWKSN